MKVILSFILFINLISCATTETKEISPTHKKAQIYYNQGTNELIQKDYTSALKHLLEANALQPNDSKIHNNLGMAYYFKNRPNKAKIYIKKAIELDPKNTDARMNLGSLYMESKNFKEAKIQFKLVSDDLTYPNQYRTFYNLGVLNYELGNINEAIANLKQSITEFPQYCSAHFKLGDIYFQNKNYSEALERFKISSQGTCYNNPEPIYHQALTYIELKQYDTAKLKLEELVERFSTGNYNQLAKNKLDALKTYSKNTEYNNYQNTDRKILSPNF